MYEPSLHDQRLYAAKHYLEEARKASRSGDHATARTSYFRCVEALKQLAKLDPKFQSDHAAAQVEYSQFARQDPLYGRTLETVKTVLNANPGILQSEIYAKIPDLTKDDLSYVLYFADVRGDLLREKKGRSYLLKLP
jgi:hypothetical protein